MKKLLLSALAVLGMATAATATEYTLDMKDATAIDGPLTEESTSDKGQVTAKHYQPLKSLKVGDFTFSTTKGSGTTDPAYYYPTKAAEADGKGVWTLRVYKQNTLTIAAPAGVKMGNIKFSGSNGKANATVTASVGGVSGVTASAMEWVNTEAVSEVTLTFSENFRIASLVVSTEGGDIPTPPAQGVFAKTTTVETGKYLFTVVEEGTVKAAAPEAADKTYGRMGLSAATVVDNTITTSEANAFDIVVADGKATIKDSYGRFYGMDSEHLTSFQFYTTANEGCYWTFAVECETVKFTNALNTDCIISQSKGNNGTWYTNIAPAKAPTEFNLPVLFKLTDGAGVENIAADADAPVEYFNLQGVRVAEPANGIFIRRQGNKVSKVAL